MFEACVVQFPAAAAPSLFYYRGTPGNVVGRMLRLNPLLHAGLLEKAGLIGHSVEAIGWQSKSEALVKPWFMILWNIIKQQVSQTSQLSPSATRIQLYYTQSGG